MLSTQQSSVMSCGRVYPRASHSGSPGPANSAPQTPRTRQHKEKRSRRPLQQPMFAAVSGSTYYPGSQPSTPHHHSSRKTHSVSPCYAGGKWSDSPSARNLPLPPDAWIEEFSTSSSASSASDSEGSVSSCDVPSTVLDRGDPSPVPAPSEMLSASARPGVPSGLRVCPLQLIKEVMASSGRH